jgi:hypothetical protein
VQLSVVTTPLLALIFLLGYQRRGIKPSTAEVQRTFQAAALSLRHLDEGRKRRRSPQREDAPSFRNLVGANEKAFREEGEELDESQSWIGFALVGPPRRMDIHGSPEIRTYLIQRGVIERHSRDRVDRRVGLFHVDAGIKIFRHRRLLGSLNGA